MNKKVIKDNMEAFTHWLNGGTVCCFDRADNCWKTLEDPKFILNYKYVINDEYVEFRKALVEGKTIQFDTSYHYPKTGEWVDLDFTLDNCKHFLRDSKFYRIKPDEPKFKVGDWVRSKSAGIFLLKSQASIDACNECFSDWRLWEPQVEEWCWNSHEGLVRVVLQHPEGDYKVWNPHARRHTNTFGLTPFIGTLPTHLQEK